MKPTNDAVDAALGILKARACDRVDYDVELEEQLMKIQNRMGGKRRSHLAKFAVAAVLCLMATGVAEATTGVISSMVRTVYVDYGDGSGLQPTENYRATTNPDGSTEVTLDVPEGAGEVVVHVVGE